MSNLSITRRELELELVRRELAEKQELEARLRKHQWYFNEYMEDGNSSKFFTRDKPHAVLVSMIFDLAEEGLVKRVSISMPRGYGKSFSTTMALVRTIGMNPDSTNMRNSHSASLAVDQLSVAVRDMINSDKFKKVFDGVELSPNKKQKDMWFLNGKLQPAYSACGIGGSAIGKRGGNFLILDDEYNSMVAAMSPAQQKINKDWISTAHDRSDTTETKFFYVCTRWIPNDTIGQKKEDFSNVIIDHNKYLGKLLNCSDEILEETYEELKADILGQYENIDDWKSDSIVILEIPLLDDDDKSTCESLVTTNEALKRRSIAEKHGKLYEFNSVDQQRPETPEGLLLPADKLATYSPEIIEEIVPDAVFAFIDPAKGGGDFLCMTIGKIIKNKLYIIDVVYSQKGVRQTLELCASRVLKHRINWVMVERNNGGDLYASKLSEKITELGSYCRITTFHESRNKEIKFNIGIDAVIDKCLFLNSEFRSKEYSDYIESLVHTPKILKKGLKDDAMDATIGIAEHAFRNRLVSVDQL